MKSTLPKVKNRAAVNYTKHLLQMVGFFDVSTFIEETYHFYRERDFLLMGELYTDGLIDLDASLN
jgi:hypothetical protein